MLQRSRKFLPSIVSLGSFAIYATCEAGSSQGIHSSTKESKRFQIYTGRGDKCELGDIIRRLKDSDVVIIGEYHDDPVAHEVELDVLKAAASLHPQRQVALSLEQFESDVQHVLNEYLSGTIRERDMLKDARAWPNYMKDYRPLVEFAKASGLPVIAANAPRRYVSLVGREGKGSLEAKLDATARSFLPPLPYSPVSPAYVSKINALVQLAHSDQNQATSTSAPTRADSSTSTAAPPTDSPSSSGASGGANSKECPYIGFNVSSKFLDAQVLWDATMAHRLASFLSANKDRSPLVVHVCGKAHMEGGLGIPEHLAIYHPNARVLTIVVEPVDSEEFATLGRDRFPQPPNFNTLADFVIASDAGLKRSYDVQHPV